jgi:hypothetical protein
LGFEGRRISVTKEIARSAGDQRFKVGTIEIGMSTAPVSSQAKLKKEE